MFNFTKTVNFLAIRTLQQFDAKLFCTVAILGRIFCRPSGRYSRRSENLLELILNHSSFKVYSRWSYTFLDLRSSECTYARKSTWLFRESFNATTIFLQLRHFLLDVLQEVRVGPIKSKHAFLWRQHVAVIYYRS